MSVKRSHHPLKRTAHRTSLCRAGLSDINQIHAGRPLNCAFSQAPSTAPEP